MNSRTIRVAVFSVGLTLLTITGTVSAEVITFGLRNHPKGNAKPPTYGFRLDELFNVSTGHDIFTFDFNHPDSNMRLVYDDHGTATLNDDDVTISGTTYGGLDTGSGYTDSSRAGLWDVFFTYTKHFVSDSNEPGGHTGLTIKIDDDSHSNLGTITPQFDVGGDSGTNGTAIALVDEDGSKEYSFKFNNFDNHRLSGTGQSGPETYVGWGWLNHGGNSHVSASDWLFTGARLSSDTVELVPEPSSIALLITGSLAVR